MAVNPVYYYITFITAETPETAAPLKLHIRNYCQRFVANTGMFSTAHPEVLIPCHRG